MSSSAKGIALWLTPEAPVERLVASRLLIGAFATVYCLVRIRYLADFSRRDDAAFAPAGIVHVLSHPLPAAATWTLAILTVVLGVLFTLGRRLAVTGPAFFVALLWSLSYANSWGKLLHTENLFLLHVGALALAGPRPDRRAAGWALRTAGIVTVLTYVIAGTMKLVGGAGLWLSGEALGNWLAWDALRKIELGSLHSPFAPFFASSPRLLQVFAIYTLVVELGAPAALVSPRLAKGWAVLAWSFHAGIVFAMAIGFWYPLSGLAFAPLLAMERLPIVRGLVQRYRL